MQPDLVIPGAVVVAVITAIIGVFVKEKYAEIRTRRIAFESHIQACNEKNIAFALLQKEVQRVAAQVEADRSTRHWLGDCMMIIGAKMNVDLPERPQ